MKEVPVTSGICKHEAIIDVIITQYAVRVHTFFVYGYYGVAVTQTDYMDKA